MPAVRLRQNDTGQDARDVSDDGVCSVFDDEDSSAFMDSAALHYDLGEYTLRDGMTTPAPIKRKVWTREDVQQLIDLEFPCSENLELIDGDLIDHMGKKHPHNYWQTLIRLWLEKTFGGEYVQVEPSIYVAENDNLKNEPNPDLVVSGQSIREYTDNLTPGDIRLLVEVADSSLNLDLGKKMVLYAQARISEYWVIDIPHELVHVHRRPERGLYAHVVKCSFTDDITPLADSNAVFRMSRL